VTGLTSPGPLPQPHSFGPRWAAELVAALQRWFDGLRGDIEIQGKLVTQSGRRRHVVDVTDASYTARLTDEIIAVNRAGAVTVTLPEAPPNGTVLSVVDAGGNADANPITIARAGSDTIVGQTSATIASPYRWMEFLYDAANTEWLAR
jgi:hypothetical protein